MAYSIEYAYKIIDEYSGELKKMMKQTEKFEQTAHKATKKAGSSFGGFFKMVGAIATADLLINAGKAVVDFLKDCDSAYLESKMAIENVANALETVGKKSGQTLPQLEDFALLLEQTTAIDADDFLQNVSGKLLKFKNITGDTFDQTQMLIADFTEFKFGAAATGEQFAATTEMIGKAMNEPSKAMKMLRGAGINLTNSQEKLIKSLEDTGNIKQAQSILFGVMKDYSGFAVKAGNTTVGMIQKIKVQIGNMKEDIGKAIEPIKLNFLQLAVKFLPYLSMAAAAVGGIITKITDIMIKLSPEIEATISDIIGFFDELVNAILYVFQGGSGGNLDEMITKVFTVITKVLRVTMSIVKSVLIALEPVFNILGQVFKIVVDSIEQFAPALDGISEAFDAIGEALKELQPVVDILMPIIGFIVKVLIGNIKIAISIIVLYVKIWAFLAKIVWGAVGSIIKFVSSVLKAAGVFKAFEAISAIFFEIQEAVQGVFSNLDGTIQGILQSIIDSPLFQAIRDIIDSILNSIRENPVFKMVNDLIAAATGLFGKGKATVNNTNSSNITNVPSPLQPQNKVDVNVGMKVYKEKGVGAVPFTPTGNLGWNGAQ